MKRVFEAAREEAAKHGVEVAFERCKKHPRMVVSKGGQCRKITFSGSPRSDHQNQEDWARQAVRRLTRQLHADLA